MPAEESVPTAIVADKYRLTRLLGKGGMGSVWEGVHTTLGTRVAVKFIETEYANSPEARSRFENEARAAAKLKSKHVVKVHDHGVMHDGRPYIVMEFLDGEPLDHRLDRLGRLPPADTARILLQVCRALTNAHSVGIVHRDLKPENVFLVWDPEDQADVVKVVDFGIAKFTDGGAGVSSATRTGSVLGTPYYMSPEQARGLRSVDFRTDLWSLGVIAFRCVVGRLPFDGEAVGDLLVKICTAPLPVPSQLARDVTPAFDAWFARALQREPEARFQSAAELADSLLVACGTSRGSVGSVAEGTIPSGPGIASSGRPNATPGGPPWPQAGAIPAQTAAPITVSVKSSPKGMLVAAIVGTLAAIAVAAFIVVKVVRPGSTPAEASAISEPAAQPAAQPSAPHVAAPDVAPTSTLAVVPASAAAETASPPATATASVATAGKPIATRPATHAPAAKPPKNPPSGTSKPPKDRPIDVGY